MILRVLPMIKSNNHGIVKHYTSTLSTNKTPNISTLSHAVRPSIQINTHWSDIDWYKVTQIWFWGSWIEGLNYIMNYFPHQCSSIVYLI